MNEAVFHSPRCKCSDERHFRVPTSSHVRQHGLVSVEQALHDILARARPVRATRDVTLVDALGRVLAADLTAAMDVPPTDNSAMDGYAVRTEDLQREGITRLQLTQRIAAGGVGGMLGPGTAARIFTGAPIPPGADAVVMQEVCREHGARVEVPSGVRRGQHIRRAAEDLCAGTRVLRKGQRLQPQHIGLAASVGAKALRVFRRLRVAVLSTGDELRNPGDPLEPGCLYNSNRYTVQAFLRAIGCEVVDAGLVADDLKTIGDALAGAAAGADVVVSTGGVSVGDEDHVRSAAQAHGTVALWGIAMKPGKPLAFGRLGDADFFGLPGNPVAAFVGLCLFVRPFLLRRQGCTRVMPTGIPAVADFALPRPASRREYLRARLEHDADGSARVRIFPNQGSGVLSSAAWCNGLAVVPEGLAVAPGQAIEFIPLAELMN